MNQPELGRKIAELRKAKGLTQEELVEKCNLSVRTLQRIESGEVTPRSYTLKTIFTALDHSGYYENNEDSVSKRPGQLFRYFIDLFNLKTNKMKKLSILTIMVSAIVLGLFLITTDSKGQNENKTGNKDSFKKSKNKEMVFSNSSCENCFDEGEIMIGRGVKFTNNGVTVNFKLVKLNKETREFNAGYIKGKILLKKVEITCAQDMINDNYMKFSADNIEKSENEIVLKGNAKITSIEGDSVETDEIVITTN